MSSIYNKLNNITLPLWTLKLSREEYDELKSLLRVRIRLNSSRFQYQKEACLYYAEWWKREYTPNKKEGQKGGVSKQIVFDSLGVDGDPEDFYRKACEGAKMLGIEIVSLDTDRRLYSMLYQGGLPMNNVSSEQTSDVWERFIRGLVLRDYDFSFINYSAEKSSSLFTFCDLIKRADEQENPELMPFYLDEEGLSWYQYIHYEIRKEKEKLAAEKPFAICWKIVIDHPGHSIFTEYVIKGPQSLPTEFLETIGKKSSDDVEVEISRNNTPVFSVNYYKNILSRKFNFRSRYTDNDIISIGIKGGRTILSDRLDFDNPHLLYEVKKGQYQIGNKIGVADSYVVFSDEWKSIDIDPMGLMKYSYDGQSYNLIHLPIEKDSEVHLNNIITGDSLCFSPRIPLAWTEVDYPENELNYFFKESIYNPACRVYKKSEKGKERCKRLQYRLVGARDWSETPPVGCCFVRPKDDQNVSPAKVISLGIGYKPKVQSGRDVCKYDLGWEYGRVRPICGRKEDGEWKISKEDCQGKMVVPCTFMPSGEARSFDLSLRMLFTDFRIYDFNMNPVCSGDTIPLCDIGSYTYSFYQSGAKDESFRFTLSKTKERHYVYCDGKKLNVSQNGYQYSVPCEGSLASLLGGMDMVSEALGKDGIPLRIDFSDFDFDNKFKYSINIAWRPFEIEKEREQPILRIVENNAGDRITYVGNLRIFPLDGSTQDPISIPREEDGTYKLPENTPPVFLVSEDNVTSNSGKLRIRMHSLDDINSEDRKNLAIESQRRIYQELLAASFEETPWRIAMYWYKQCMEYSLPASKLHHLKLIGSNESLLYFFLFHIFTLSEKNGKEIIEDLLEFEDGLSLKWWWFEKKGVSLDAKKLDTESFPEILYNWSRKQSIYDNDTEALKKTLDMNVFLDDHFFDFYRKLMNEFETFRNDLIKASKSKTVVERTGAAEQHIWKEFIDKDFAEISSYDTPDDPYLDHGSDLSDDMEEMLFPRIVLPEEFQNYGPNSKKLLKRVARVVEYINGQETDIFFSGTAEDICLDNSIGLNRVQWVRNSIMYYLNKDMEAFIAHLLYLIRKTK